MATNFEYYKDKILNEFIKEYKMHCFVRAMGIATGVEFHVRCEGGPCSDCEKIVFEWLYAEHIEAPKLTKRERAFCEAVQTGWIARDEDNGLYWYANIPEKNNEVWGGHTYSKISHMKLDFAFIEWEDEKPWAVEDLLKLEVMEEVQEDA